MFESVLVANRGEIARRIFRTCRQMGLATIAVFSDPDRHAPFVTEADDAFALGGSSASDSYLRIDRILEAAKLTGAGAIHPGYGFLAENAEFAQAVLDAELVWIGPPPDAIAAMGSKLDAKRLMDAAGVPTLPSVDLTGLAEDAIRAAADDIGYPLLVKASAGGGGKGMLVVRQAADLVETVRAAERQAASAFGDGTVFLEKYMADARHVEIQVLGDSHNTIVPLFERECSIQRRHQKIVEEAPSTAVSADLRARMSEAAVTAAQAVGYVGAGTVEFLLADDSFWFLEMNTRLQVEHPVTEEITGLDLVRLQFLVASGAPLPFEATSPVMSGHAIEARIYAEDAEREFLPVTGRLTRFRFPAGIRVDSGVEEGSEVSVHYDPLLAKVIAYAPTRPEAVRLLATALQKASIHGMTTNRDLLVRVLRHPEFLAGHTDTGFLHRHDPASLGAPLPSPEERDLAGLAAALYDLQNRRNRVTVLATIPPGWRNNPADPQLTVFDGQKEPITIGYRLDRSGWVATFGDGDPQPFSHVIEDDRVTLELAGRRRSFLVHADGDTFDVDGPTGHTRLVARTRFPAPASATPVGSLQAPMPGKVLEVRVSVGDSVEAGQSLLVMEAMKMEHTLRAPVAGTVESVRAVVGEQVDADAPLVVIGEVEQ